MEHLQMLCFIMLKILVNSIKYSYKTRRAWFFTASARTKARFARTLLGNYWLGISNLLVVLSLGFVYGLVLRVDNFRDYFIYLGLGITTWTIFGNAINSAPNIFIQNSSNLINTTLDPLYYVLEEWVFQIQSFIQVLVILLVFLGFLDFNLVINFLFYSPLHLLNIFIFIFWAPLFIGMLAIRFCDLFQLVPIVLQLNFLLSPILYEEKNLGDYSFLMNFNPLYKILAAFRDSIINANFDFDIFFKIFFVNILMVMVSLYFFSKKKKRIIFYL